MCLFKEEIHCLLVLQRSHISSSLAQLERVQLDTVLIFKVHRAVHVHCGSGRSCNARGSLGNVGSLDEEPGPVLSPPKDGGGQKEV